jgi:bacteriorhodopsin
MRIIVTFILISSILFLTGLVDYIPMGVPVEQPNVRSDWVGLVVAIVLILLPVLIYKFSNRKPKEILENRQEQEAHKEFVDSNHGDEYQK